jgi:hypothetical protein
MQVEDDAVEPPEVRVEGHRSDVVHRAGVAGEGRAVRVGGIRDGGTGDDSRGFARRHMEALDGDGALHRAGPHLAAQLAQPGTRDAGGVAKADA